MRLPIAPILRVPPAAGSLLQSVSAVPGDWRSGVCFTSRAWANYGWPDCVPDWEACNSVTLADKPVGSGFSADDSSGTTGDLRVGPACELVCFDPFTVYTPVTEESVTPDDIGRLTSEARAAHEAMLSYAVAKVLAGGGPGAGDGIVFGHAALHPFCIEDNDVDLETAAGAALDVALNPKNALAALLHWYGCTERSSGGAMLHAPLALLPGLIADGVVAQVGNRYIGPAGVVVVADAGYCDMSAAGADHAATGFLYISGPVEVSTGGPTVINGAEFEDARMNQWALLIEERVIYRFDPRSVARVGYTR